MAGPLAAVERFFERLFERPAARLFQARLEPVHLQRHLERAMEAQRRMEGRRAYVPSRYRIRLHPTDLAALEVPGGSLAVDLAETLHAHARRRGYLLTARPQVLLAAGDGIPPGEVQVDTEGVSMPRRTTIGGGPGGVHRTEPPRPPAGYEGDRPEPDGTAVYRAPTTNPPKAVLAVQIPGRPPARVAIQHTLRIGRALDNDLVLPDERVSRHHGQISVRMGMLVYRDLGSTNGSFLNGSGVTEIALGPTDVLQVGGSSLTIESGS